ncbi:Chaperone protein DnaJ [hydrothermal vent metagenome]|uniref:Chaperone protein DnaJ n=1 Tax=hydrothermal vent metagenome TaxID=652676 RepID=A0A3B1CHG1_9ZZZZ
MIKRDYYEILEVQKNASGTELKKAYRKKAMQYHPDQNPGDHQAEENFKEAAEAYGVLSDQEKRSLYDQFGHDGLNQKGFSGFGGFDDIFSSFSDIFGDVFGFSGGQRQGGSHQPRRGADLRLDMVIEFMEAMEGVEKEVEFDKYVICDVCKGSRSQPGKPPVTCQTCGGAGKVTRSQGFFSIASTCPDCRGEGARITHPCKKCKGAGQEPIHKKLIIKAPAGVDTGSRLRVQGEGEEGKNGGPAGDLYVIIHVNDHEYFQRNGDDILLTTPVTLAQAALGADLKIPSLEGEIDFAIKAGTQSNTMSKIPGKGAPRLRGYGRGDMLVRVVLNTPESLSKREEELYRELAEIEGKTVRPHQKGFFEKFVG